MAEKNGVDMKAKPMIEWIAAAIGLVLTLAILGFVGWQAIAAPERMPPAIEIQASEVTRVPGGFVVEFTARNASPQTAATVEIEGTLRGPGGEPEKSNTTLDYVPGNSEREGGLFFSDDPRAGSLEIRALGYARP